ncbi:MAG: putative zinc-binding protein [Methanocorpusculum sp.]|nr:putative zinc-binding protein [Methanocorpusculum sp.]
MTEIALITCSCPANTGKLAEKAAASFNQKNPGMIDETMNFRDLKNLKFIDLDDADIVVLQGCENDCPLKRLEKDGINPTVVLKASDFGFVRNGTDDPSFADIEKIAAELKKCIRGL